MARGDKRNYQAATFRLPPGLLDELEAESSRSGLPKSTIVERAIRAWIAACSDGECEGNMEKPGKALMQFVRDDTGTEEDG